MFKSVFLSLGLMFFLTGCTGFLSSTEFYRDTVYADTGVHELERFPILRATGYASISKQIGENYAVREIRAMRASRVEAYRELSEQVNGIYIKSLNNVMADSREEYHVVKTDVEGFVHGARVIRQYPLGDIYATELELDTKVLYDMYQMRGAF